MDAERVQAIAVNANKQDTIPDVFIRPEKEQPGLTTFKGPAPDIPVIDFSNDQNDIVRLIDNASTEFGLFQITNHGIPVEVIDKLQSVGKHFFALPEEEKELYSKEPNAKSIEGYGTKIQKEVEGKKAWADHLFHYIYPPSRINYKFWPNMPSYKEINEEYAKYLKIVVDRLLVYLSLGLGLGENVVKDVVGGDEIEYLFKINYYPPCPRPDLALGVVPHTDMSALTVLIPNEVQGLQMFKDERWIEVQYIPKALIVHIGDQIEIVSNGKYKAVFHRATVDKDKTRISWPVFCEPPKEVVVGPLPQLVNDANPPKYKAKKFKDYQYCKLNKIPQ